MSVILACAALWGAAQTVWLSDLDLSKARQGWGKPSANVSVEGHPLTLDGQVYAHGFGTHSPGRLEVHLGEAARRFQATVGIDDEVPATRGSAEFIVVGSNRRILWRSGVLRRGDKPKVADVPLSGESELSLIVSDGGDGYEFDHSDWADARITYDGARPFTVDYQPTEPVIARISNLGAPRILGPAVVGVRPGNPLLWRVPAIGDGPMRFSATRLPAGLRLDPATGVVTGALSAAGSYAIGIAVRNDKGETRRTVRVGVGDRIALTPPMGWNSYDAFGDNVREDEVRANAEYLLRNMAWCGWNTVVVDYRWYDPGAHDNNPNARAGAALSIDPFGRLLPAPNRFPSARDMNGFKALADEFHREGLRFGVHIMRGIPRLAVDGRMPIEGSTFTAADAGDTNDKCGWCPDMYGVRGNTAAGQAYYDSLFRLYAKWGLDFVKMDDASSPYHTDEIAAVHRAIEKCGRSIVLSLSPGETPLQDGDQAASNANQWRVSGDFWDNWSALEHEFTLAEKWQKWVGPGHWPDPDMLPLGRLSVGNRSVDSERFTRFTRAEQVTLISLWCLLPAPLMLGADMTHADEWTLNLLTNPDVLAVDQDAVTAGARLALRKNGIDVWTRSLSDGSTAIGIFNRGEFDVDERLDWAAFGVTRHSRVRDLWRRVPLKAKTVTIPSHGAALLRAW